MNKAQIKLAKAMGWKWDDSIRPPTREYYPVSPCWIKPDGDKWFAADAMPDPFTDANDCDALKKYMQSQGWHIQIGWQHLNENAHSDSYLPAPAIYVEIWHCGTEQHERYDTDRGEPYTVAACACLALGIPLHVEDTNP